MEGALADPAVQEGLIANFSNTATATLCDAAQLAEAQQHGKASEVYPLEPSDVGKIREEDRCPCCFFPHNHLDKFPLITVDALRGLGLGFPFLFYLTGYLLGMMAVILAVAAVPCLVGNLLAEEEYGSENGIAASSLGGMKKGRMDGYWPAVLNLIALVLVCICYTLATIHLRRHTKRLNQGVTNPSDFTVVVKNLGPNFDADQLKSHLQQSITSANFLWGSVTTAVQVEKCDISYDIREYMRIVKEIQSLTMCQNASQEPYKAQERFCRCLTGCCFPHSIHYVETVENYDEKISTYQGTLNAMQDARRDVLQTGVAFVALHSQAQVKAVLRAWKANIFSRFLYSLCPSSSPRVFNGRVLNIKRAPEPTDIIWENLRFSRVDRLIRQVATLVILAAILVCSCFILIGLANWQRDLRDSNENSAKVSFSSIPAAAIILLVNILLDLAIRLMSYLECHHTYTEQTLSTARKLTIVLSLNTLLFPLLANLDSDQWYGQSGLANNIFWVAISTAFAKSIIKLFHPLMVWRKLRKWEVTRAINRTDRAVFVSQAKANYYYQNEEIDIADCYSDLMVRFILALAYAPLLPVIVPITILGYFFDYLVNKFVLLRLSCRPKLLSEKITYKMLFFVKPALVLYGLSILFFFKNLNSDTLPIGIIAAVIGITFWPVHSLFFSVIFRFSKEKSATSRSFPDLSLDFLPVLPTQTYEMTNPVTRTKAMLELSLRDSRLRTKPKASVPRYENLNPFDTQHFGLTGIWNLSQHKGSEERERTGEPRVESEGVLGGSLA